MGVQSSQYSSEENDTMLAWPVNEHSFELVYQWHATRDYTTVYGRVSSIKMAAPIMETPSLLM